MASAICGGIGNAVMTCNKIFYCYKCKRRRLHRCWFEEYYGWAATCKTCKETSTDGD